jgi:hypothetical protein
MQEQRHTYKHIYQQQSQQAGKTNQQDQPAQ